MNLLEMLNGGVFVPPTGTTRVICMDKPVSSSYKKPPNTKEEIQALREEVINLLKEGYCTVPLLMDHVSAHVQTVRKVIGRLIEEGLVQARAGKSPIVYTLTGRFYAGPGA